MGMHVGSGTGATRVKPERPCTVHRRTVAFAPRKARIRYNMIPQYCVCRGAWKRVLALSVNLSAP